MKLTSKLVVLFCFAIASSAVAQYTPQDAFNVVAAYESDIEQTPVAGDAYLITPGVGGAGGFAFSMIGAVDSVFDGATETVGTTLENGLDVSSSDSIADLGGNAYTVTLNVSAAESLSPAGFSVGGLTADTAGLFMGGNAGANPLDFPAPAIVSLATVEILDLAGGNLAGPFDITGFGNFTAGTGGGWDGGVGVTFGAGSAGADIGGYELNVTYTIPEPSSATLLGLTSLLGLGFIRRR